MAHVDWMESMWIGLVTMCSVYILGGDGEEVLSVN